MVAPPRPDDEAGAAEPGPPEPPPHASPPRRDAASGPLLTAVAVTAVVTAVSNLTPDGYANTAVGAAFLGATWLLAVHGRDTDTIRRFGLGLGGLTEAEPISVARIVGDGAKALAWALAIAVVVFPLFWVGYTYYWETGAFAPQVPADFADRVLGQLLVVALPEEAFYRGYLQTALEDAWHDRKRRVLGVELGLGWLASAAIFAVGHLLTIPHPARLAVFFPALLFGWLRARTGGIGAGVALHAMSNLLSAFLADAYR